jgi:hypothetical protein
MEHTNHRAFVFRADCPTISDRGGECNELKSTRIAADLDDTMLVIDPADYLFQLSVEAWDRKGGMTLAEVRAQMERSRQHFETKEDMT